LRPRARGPQLKPNSLGRLLATTMTTPTTPTITSPGPGPKSRVVTVIAWLALGISALSMLGALVSTLVLAYFPGDVNQVVNKVLQDTAFVRVMPRALGFELHHPVLIRLVQFVVWTVALVCAIGLLRRKDWARRLFTGLLGLAIVSVLFSFYMGQSMVWSLFSRRWSPGREIPEAVGSGMALGWLMIFGVVGLLLWLIVWFRSARIRAEFAAADSAA
jgi:hypothetical protein